MIQEWKKNFTSDKQYLLDTQNVIKETSIELNGPYEIFPKDLKVASDPSSAAFFIVAALITPNSQIELKNILLIEDSCESMGAYYNNNPSFYTLPNNRDKMISNNVIEE